MARPTVDIWSDYVLFAGTQRLTRPWDCPPTLWVKFWQQANDDRGDYDDGFEDGIEYQKQNAAEGVE